MSDLEASFDTHWRILAGPDLEREYRFAALASGGTGKGTRARVKAANAKDWKFDRAHSLARVAVEIEGGTWMQDGGRHNRPSGFSDDCVKYNWAQAQGWAVFRLTSDMLRDAPAQHLAPIIATIEARLVNNGWLQTVANLWE